MTRHGKAAATQSMEEGSSGRVSDSLTTGKTQHSGDSQDAETSFALEAVGKIEALVESFRMEKATKSQTIYKISQILAAESTGDEQLKLDSLD